MSTEVRLTTTPHLTVPGRPAQFTAKEVTLDSSSGMRPGILSLNPAVSNATAVILCPGLAVGMDGPFIRGMEEALLGTDLVRWSLRFNFSGHASNLLNQDLRGFTFSRAAADFSAGVKLLRAEGAEHIIAITSSVGTQAAVLANCTNESSGHVEGIIGRASILDCCKSILARTPAQMLQDWRNAGQFEFPIGNQSVLFGSDLLDDIASFTPEAVLPGLRTPLALVHGTEDRISPLALLRATAAHAPQSFITLHSIDGAGHDFEGASAQAHRTWMIETSRSLLSSLGQ